MTDRANRDGGLWPHGPGAALLAVPVVWILLTLVLSITGRLAAWPPPGTRRVVIITTVVVSLVPLALWLLDRTGGGWWSGRRDIADRRSEALAEIHRNRLVYEDMVWRAARPPAPPPAPAGSPPLDPTLARFDQLVVEAGAADSEALGALVEEAEALAQRRAYLCPEQEITAEAKSHLLTLVDWGVPTQKIDSLREAAAAAFATPVDPAAGRGALHVIVVEFDAWAAYVDDYNAKSSFWTSVFLATIGVLAIAALVMMLGPSWRIVALFLAAIAGATASVMARLPGLTSYGEWVVNLRAYQARIGTGIVGSLVGMGLLASGLVPISLPKDWRTPDVLIAACLAPADRPLAATTGAGVTPPPEAASRPASTAPACDRGAMLFVLAITLLLGFSERLLTSLEGRVIGPVAGATAPGKPS